MIRSAILTTLALVLVTNAFGQQMPVFNQYLYNGYLYNPACAGTDSLANIYVSHRQQWTKMTDAPVTTGITMDGAIFKSKVGLGVAAYLDQVHLTQRLGVMMSYAYHIPLSKRFEHKLSIGMSFGFVNQRLKLDENTLIYNPADPTLFNHETVSNAFDMAFGINYRWKKLNISLSVPQLANSDIRYKDEASGNAVAPMSFRLRRHFYAKASYVVRFGPNSNYSLEPGAMARVFPNLPTQVDVFSIMRFKEKAWFSIGYRSGNDSYSTAGINFSVGFQAFKMFSLTCTYENVLDNTDRKSLGHTFEFLLGVKFGGAQRRIMELERRINTMDEKMVIQVDSVVQIRNMEELDERKVLRETIREVVRNGSEVDERMRVNNTDVTQVSERLEETRKELERLKEELKVVQQNPRGNNLLKGGGHQDTLSSIFFTQGSKDLTEYSKSRLNLVGAQLVSNYDATKIQIVIYGNASQEGDNEANLLLSLKRAKEVKEYLLNLGIRSEFIITIPNGEEAPITNDQSTEEQRRKNRRVDIIVIAP